MLDFLVESFEVFEAFTAVEFVEIGFGGLVGGYSGREDGFEADLGRGSY